MLTTWWKNERWKDQAFHIITIPHISNLLFNKRSVTLSKFIEVVIGHPRKIHYYSVLFSGGSITRSDPHPSTRTDAIRRRSLFLGGVVGDLHERSSIKAQYYDDRSLHSCHLCGRATPSSSSPNPSNARMRRSYSRRKYTISDASRMNHRHESWWVQLWSPLLRRFGSCCSVCFDSF